MQRTGNNFVLFNLGWIASVIFMVSAMPAMALGCIAVVVALRLAAVAVPMKEGLFIGIFALAGCLLVSLLPRTGLMTLTGSPEQPGIPELWLVGLWVLFATTINSGFRWIKRSWGASAFAGSVLGILSYMALAGLGMIEARFPTMISLGLSWSVLMPLLALVADTIIDSSWLEPTSHEEIPQGAGQAGLELEFIQR